MNDVPVPPDEPAVASSEMAGTSPAVPAAATSSGYPVNLEMDHQEEYSRFLPIIKWLLLIPQYFVYFFVVIGAMFVAFAAFFAVLFTAKYPRGMWDYMVGVQRWGLRLNAYAYFATDKYPPFTLQETPEDTVRLFAEYPEHVSRWRALFAWLVGIPYFIVAYVVIIIGQICSFFGFFTILFTKKLPMGLFDMIRKAMLWSTRAGFYMYFMSTVYPPFDWDE